ncbi:hypothetical protein ABKN59_003567 [Abortiporus biennis]
MRLHFLFFSTFVFSQLTLAEWVNRTIDDQLGDAITGLQVTYTSSAGLWVQGATCDHCAFHPSNASAFDGTWHDGSRTPQHDEQPLEFTVKFNGTAIYLFNIAVRLTLTDVNFTLDGSYLGRYTQFFNVTDQYLYNVPIFALDSIPYSEHTLVVSAFGPNYTIVFFDYALYTTNTSISDPLPDTSQPLHPTTSFGLPYGTSVPSSGQSSNSDTNSQGSSSQSNDGTAHDNANATGNNHKENIGAIVGGVVGGVGFIVILLLIGLFFFRRKHRPIVVAQPTDKSGPLILEDVPLGETKRGQSQSRKIEPFVIPSSSTQTTSPLKVHQSATSTEDFDSIGRSVSSPGTDSSYSGISLREQLRTLRTELEVMRSYRETSSSHRTPSTHQSTTRRSLSYHAAPSSIVSPLKGELESIRMEVAQLRAEQDKKCQSTVAPPTPMDTTTLVRELAKPCHSIHLLLHQTLGTHKCPFLRELPLTPVCLSSSLSRSCWIYYISAYNTMCWIPLYLS